MRMTFEKLEVFTVDTGKERKRISGFKKKEDEEIKDKLNELMDLIEAQDWKRAYDELEGDWWQGDDSKRECSRLEFIGLLHVEGKPWVSYADLVNAMVDSDCLKVINIEK